MKRRTRTGGAILMLALLAAGLLPGCAAFREAFSETPEQTAARQRRAEQRKARENTTAREEVFPSFFQRGASFQSTDGSSSSAKSHEMFLARFPVEDSVPHPAFRLHFGDVICSSSMGIWRFRK